MSRIWFLLSLFLLCASAQAQTRRALLVGIDRYAAADPAPTPWKPTALRPVPLSGVFQQVTWPKLNGAVNDMKSMHRMLLTRGFQEQDIIELVNDQAIGDAILNTLKSHLIDAAKAGDSSLFYFAGHGARILNKHASLPGGYDVAMVPYDAPKGVPGLRNKELARIYRHVPDGVSLTVIQDNCYSSGGARGVAPPLVTRDAPDDSRTVDDPPEPNVKPVDQQENAVLILAASQPDQKAEELDVTDDPGLTGDSGLPHGRFTYALLQAMRDSLPNESTAIVFQRTRNYMHSGNTTQEPSMLGLGRGEKGLFGQPAVSANAIVPMVKDVTAYTVLLDRGQATGLREGCELRQVSAAGKNEADPKMRLQITRLIGLDEAEATVMGAARLEDLHRGDRFVVDRWISFSGAALSVYVPAAAPPMDDLLALAASIKSVADRLKLTWVMDPTVRVPDFTVRWNGRSWELRRATGKTTDLGAKPAGERLAADLRGVTKGDFFLELPPPAEWLPKGLKLGEGTENAAIAVYSKSPASAQYMLAGAWSGDRIEYAWLAPNLTQETLNHQLQHVNQANVPVNVALPLRTKAVKAGAGSSQPPYALTDYALRLAKVRGWLLLEPPAETAMPFPYHVTLKDVSTGKVNASGTVVEDQVYQIVLQSDRKTLDDFVERYQYAPGGVPKSFVYVFVIDSSGTGVLVFPARENNGVVNHLPAAQIADGRLPAEIPIPTQLKIGDPFGVDSYMLLTTATALGNPDVLNFEGPGGTRGGAGDGPLERLLGGLGSRSRGIRIPAPADWSIERTFIRSIPK
jgi:hypothetical protein